MSNSLHDTLPFCPHCRTYHSTTDLCANTQPPAKEIPIQKQQLDNKLVNAAPMTRRQYLEKMQWPHDPNNDDLDAHGYYLESIAHGLDNKPLIQTWLPAQQFGELYHRVQNMTFELAFQCARKGERIRRAIWSVVNGHVYVAELEDGSKAFRRRGALDLMFTWEPSTNDLFAEDWQVVQDDVDEAATPA